MNWTDNNVLGGFHGSDDFIPPSLLSFEVFDLISDANQLLINYEAVDQSGLSWAHASFSNSLGDTLFF